MKIRNNKQVGFIKHGTSNIDKIYHGTDLIFEQGFDREESGSTPLTTSHEAIGKNLKNYRIYGNSVQDGTPSPSNPVEIQSVGDRTNNEFNKKSLSTYGYTSSTYTVDGKKCVSIYDTSTHGLTFTNFKANTQYTFSFSAKYVSAHGFIRARVTYTDMTAENIVNADATANWKSYSFTTASGKSVSNIVFSNAGNGSGYAYYIDIDSFRLNEGTEALDYEPYGYKIPVIASGKNLVGFEDFEVTATSNIKSYNSTTDIYEYRARGSSVAPTVLIADSQFSNYCLSKSHTPGTYILTINYLSSLTFSEEKIRIQLADGTYDYIYEGTPTTISQNFNLVGLYIKSKTVSANTSATYRIMLERVESASSTASEYEKFLGYDTKNIYLDEPLRKVGNYADYINFKEQKRYDNVIVNDDTGTLPIDQSYSGTVDSTGTAVVLSTIPSFKTNTMYQVYTNIQPSSMYAKYKSK